MSKTPPKQQPANGHPVQKIVPPKKPMKPHETYEQVEKDHIAWERQAGRGKSK